MATPSHLDRYADAADRQAPGRQAFRFAVAVELAALNDYYQTDVYPKRECVWLPVSQLTRQLFHGWHHQGTIPADLA